MWVNWRLKSGCFLVNVPKHAKWWVDDASYGSGADDGKHGLDANVLNEPNVNARVDVKLVWKPDGCTNDLIRRVNVVIDGNIKLGNDEFNWRANLDID
jgi:hypothetical protein